MHSQKSSASSARRPLLLGLFGLILVIAFVARVGLGAVGQELGRLGPGAIWILVPYGVGTSIGALPWARLLPRAVRPSLGGTIASRFAASGSNALLPFFGVAGEPSRLLWLPSEARPQGLAAIVVDRLLYNSASALLLLLAALASFSTRLPASLRAAASAAGLVTLLLTLGAAWLVAHAELAARLSRLLRKWLGGSAEGQFGEKTDAALQRLLRRFPGLGSGLLLHFVARSVMVAETYVALRSLHAPASLADALVLGTAPIASALFASSIPSQLGVQEGVLMLTCKALGLGAALGLALGLLTRLRQLFFVPLTPMLLALPKAEQRRGVRSYETQG